MGSTPRRSRRYDVFVSYSHAADGRLAPAVQGGIERLGSRWPHTHRLRVFRDQTGLSADASLWSAIERALENAEWFLLLASPDAAASHWVQRELDHWIARHSVDRVLVVLTDGEWTWNPAANQLAGDAVPPNLVAAFVDEPRHIDLRWARSELDLDLDHARFRSAIAELSAPVHGVTKDELEGDHVRERRRLRRRVRATVGSLTALTLIAASSAVVAMRTSAEATEQARRATAQALLVSSANVAGERPDLALLYAAEAAKLDPSPATRSALLERINAEPLLEQVVTVDESERPLVLSAEGSLMVTSRRGGLVVRSTEDGRMLRSVSLDPAVDFPPTSGPAAAPGEDPSLLIAIDEASPMLAIAGTERPNSIDLWSLDGEDSDGPNRTVELDARVVEIAWTSPTHLLAKTDARLASASVLVPPEELAGALRLVDVSNGTVRRLDDVSQYWVGSPGLSVAPASGRFAAVFSAPEGQLRTSVLDVSGAVVATVPRDDTIDTWLTRDGAHLIRTTYGPPAQPDQPAVERLALDGTVEWRLGPEDYFESADGQDFGRSLSGIAPSAIADADGGRIRFGDWLVGPEVGDSVIRHGAPAGTRKNAFAYRIQSLDGSGTTLTTLTPTGAIRSSAAVLVKDLSCPVAKSLLLGNLPLTKRGESWGLGCRSELQPNFALPAGEEISRWALPVVIRSVATSDREARRIGVLSVDGAGQPRGWRIVDLATSAVTDLTPALLELGLVDQAEVSLGMTISERHVLVARSPNVLDPSQPVTTDLLWVSIDTGAVVDRHRFDGEAVIDWSRGRVLGIQDDRLVELGLDEPAERRVIDSVRFEDDPVRLALVPPLLRVSEGPAGDERVRLFDAEFRRVPIDLGREDGPLAVSDDGHLVAIRRPGSVDVIDLVSRTVKGSIEIEQPISAVFTADGLGVSSPAETSFLDLRTQQRTRLSVKSELFAPSLTADGDHSIVELSSSGVRRHVVGGDLIAEACRRAGRGLTPSEWREVAAITQPGACG